MGHDSIELSENLLTSDISNNSSPSRSPLPSSPEGETTIRTVQFQGHTLTIFPKNWRASLIVQLQILLCFVMFTSIGISDQTVGSLIPVLTSHYSTTQTTITTVFILQFLGYSVSALSNAHLHSQIGRRGVIFCGIACLCLSFLVNSTMPPLLIYVVMHFFYGLGVGLMDSCMNVYLSSLVDHNELMGLLHGFYGVGSMIGPPMVSHILVATGGGQTGIGGRFGFHYLILSGVAVLGLLASSWLFRFETRIKYEYELQLEHENEEEEFQSDGFWSLMSDRLILSFAMYLFLYVGTEISIGSWLLSYLLKMKNLKQVEASYIVSMFWVGLTIGRMGLGFVTKTFKNEYRANLTYSLLSLVFFTFYTIFTTLATNDFTTANWFIKTINALLVINSGIWIGPLFPTANVCLMKIIPAKLHVSAVGIMTSIGGTGSAILPFSVGWLVDKTGFVYMPFYVVVIISGYCILWACVPKLAKSLVRYDF